MRLHWAFLFFRDFIKPENLNIRAIFKFGVL